MSEAKRSSAALAVARGTRDSYSFDPSAPMRMGRISNFYRAEAIGNGGEACLKVLHAGIAPSSQKRFEHEIEAMSALRHPNILPLLDTGVIELSSPVSFIALPLCRGGDLSDLLQSHAFLPRDRALALLSQVAAALDYAHSQGIIHGDVKPENVLLDDRGDTAYLSDFGISKYFDFTERAITAAHGCEGTSDYMAPEQIVGSESSAASDIYAFGMLAFRAIVGALPFPPESTPATRMFAKVNGELLNPRDVDPNLDAATARALLWALQASVRARPRSAGDLVHALETGKVPRRPRGAGMHWWARLGTGERVAVVLGVIGAVVTLLAAVLPLLLR